MVQIASKDDLNKLYSPISFLLTGIYMFFDENIKNNNNV